MIQIIPAILATNEQEYKDKLEKINGSQSLKGGWIQIDLMDTKFVQNKSISPDLISKFPTDLKLEAHLMVEYPENWIDELIKVDVDKIIFPVEDFEGIKERIEHIKNHNVKVGLSINPETDVDMLNEFISTIDSVLVMSVNPGFGGQEFIEKSLERVKVLRVKYKDLVIGVDGGINKGVVSKLVDAGASYLVIGSHLLEGDIDENFEKIWEAIFNHQGAKEV